MEMKAQRERKKSPLQTISVGLRQSTIRKADDAAEKNDLSRQKLIDLVLDQALSDPNFILRIPEGY